VAARPRGEAGGGGKARAAATRRHALLPARCGERDHRVSRAPVPGMTPMGMPAMRAAHLVIDVNDLDRAAAFWAALLELDVSHRGPDWVDLSPLGAHGPVLSFQLVPERKVVKNRLHIDVAVERASGGVVAAGQRAQALGATPASDLQSAGSNPWQVWRDPEGNEFCLVTEADVIDLASSEPVSESLADDAGMAH